MFPDTTKYINILVTDSVLPSLDVALALPSLAAADSLVVFIPDHDAADLPPLPDKLVNHLWGAAAFGSECPDSLMKLTVVRGPRAATEKMLEDCGTYDGCLMLADTAGLDYGPEDHFTMYITASDRGGLALPLLKCNLPGVRVNHLEVDDNRAWHEALYGMMKAYFDHRAAENVVYIVDACDYADNVPIAVSEFVCTFAISEIGEKWYDQYSAYLDSTKQKAVDPLDPLRTEEFTTAVRTLLTAARNVQATGAVSDAEFGAALIYRIAEIAHEDATAPADDQGIEPGHCRDCMDLSHPCDGVCAC